MKTIYIGFVGGYNILNKERMWTNTFGAIFGVQDTVEINAGGEGTSEEGFPLTMS